MTKFYQGDVVSVMKSEWNHGSVRPAFVYAVYENGSMDLVCFSSTVKKGKAIESRRGRDGNGLTRDSWVAAASTRKGGIETDAVMRGCDAADVVSMRGYLNDQEWAQAKAEVRAQLSMVGRRAR